MKLILTRHGETLGNKEGIAQGHLPGKLSETGIEQAKRLALRLKDEKIDVIYSSDLARAADTAKEIAKHHPKIPIHFVRELREQHLGEFEGKRVDKNNLSIYVQPKGGESLEQLFNRAKRFLEKIIEKNRDDIVLFVAHRGINKAVMAVIFNEPENYNEKIEGQGNTAITIFEIKEDKNHVIHLMNCTNHLD